MAGVYLVWVVALLEGASRFGLSERGLFERVRGGSDAAWRLEWVRRHAGGVEVYYPFDVYHPTRGWAVKPLLRGADVFGPGSVNSNSEGLRGTTEFTLEKPAGKTRVLAFGDSFTFGDEVADGETWVARLQELLPAAEVLNFGVHGYGHDQMLVYLREEGVRYQPDLVLLGFVQDDMPRNLLEFRDYAKPRFEPTAAGLALRNVPVPPPAEVLAAERFRPRLLDLLDVIYQAYLRKVDIAERRMKRVTEAILDAMVEDALAAGAVTVFAYLPHSQEITDPELNLEAEVFFTDYCYDRAAYCLNLRPAFAAAHAEGLPLKTAGHWHATGHRLAAAEIADYLTARGLVPPRTDRAENDAKMSDARGTSPERQPMSEDP